jgi:uncharacterized protein YndB with AHSA1/START domain
MMPAGRVNMARIELHQDVRAPRERVFELIADLHGYGRWLPPSDEYHGTSEISPPPVRVGTTYRESSPSGVRRGVVTVFDPPRSVVFHQPMTLRPSIAGTIDVTVSLSTSIPDGGSGVTHVTRLVEIGMPWWLIPLRPVIVRRFRIESERMLRALTTFSEA